MLDFVSELFDSDRFMPHGHCYMWRPALLWLQVLTNAAIGTAYVAIAATLGYLVYKGRYVPFKGVALAFGVFIVTCGATHFFDVYLIWDPVYWLDGGVRAITAIASVGTAVMLPALVPKMVVLSKGARRARERGVELEAMLQDLEATYEKERELDQAKTRFFANVSHELRTPLTLILGPTRSLLGDDSLSPAQRRQLEVVLRNARALLSHVEDLLDLSEMESGAMNAQYRKLELGETVRGAIEHFEIMAAERHVDLITEVGELEIEADPDKVSKILVNLLSNAFKFTPAEGTIRVTAGERDDRVFVEVADSGPGVPPEQRESVFERFVQGTAEDDGFGGTGLGLAICREFAMLHGGDLRIADAPEGGALFRLELPRRAPEGSEVLEGNGTVELAAKQLGAAAASELKAADPGAPEPEEDSGLPRVLVVEDNPDMNRFVCESLSDYQTDAAFDGREALSVLETRRPDLIVTDVMMPGMSGDKLVHEVRQRTELDAIPILVLTARADDSLRVQLLERGAQDYVAKPFAADELHARVANLLKVKRTQDVLQRELEIQISDLHDLASEVALKKRELQTALGAMRVARDHAERASQIKSRFLRLISHELRTPTSALLLQIERLREQAAEGAIVDLRLVERMSRSGGRLHRLIDSLLQHARIEGGRLNLEWQTFDARDVMRAVSDELRPQIEHKDLELRVRVPESRSELESDRELFHVVVANLLVNAMKFTSEGFVALSLEVADTMIAVSVEDSGPGIPMEQQASIFEPFEQGEALQHKHESGMGLGLTIVRDVTRALGGSIELDSTPGKGTMITVTFPRTRVFDV